MTIQISNNLITQFSKEFSPKEVFKLQCIFEDLSPKEKQMYSSNAEAIEKCANKIIKKLQDELFFLKSGQGMMQRNYYDVPEKPKSFETLQEQERRTVKNKQELWYAQEIPTNTQKSTLIFRFQQFVLNNQKAIDQLAIEETESDPYKKLFSTVLDSVQISRMQVAEQK